MEVVQEEHKTPTEPGKTMTIDEAYDFIGKFGRYQILVIACSFITMITCMMYIFSVPLFLIFPKITGCPKPGGDSVCADVEEACKDGVTRSYTDPHHNFVSEFDLVCSDFSAAAIELAFVAGSLIGSFMFSTLSDNFGRLRIICIGQASCIVGMALIIITSNYYACVVISGLVGFFVAASGTPTYAFSYDSSHSSCIKFHGTFINLSFAIGEVIVALLMWTGIGWRTMCAIVICWSASFFLVYFRLVEPPRFLLSRGRKEEALVSLRYMAGMNSKPLPEKLELCATGDLDKQANSFSEIWALLSEKSAARQLAMCMFLFFSCGCIYYGISMNIQKYKGNVFLNATLNGAVEVVSVFFSAIMMNAFGIRLPFALSFATTAVFMLLQAVAESPYASAFTVSMGKFGISACFNFVYIIVGEMFPSAVKNTALGLCLIADRIGSITGPVVGLNQTLFRVVATVLCLLCIIVVLRLRSTGEPSEPEKRAIQMKA